MREDVTERLLEQAMIKFLDKGYTSASLRTQVLLLIPFTQGTATTKGFLTLLFRNVQTR